ncbi:MAG: uracil phosphoribosyltransferase [Acaryochloris sp. RU_4_1]|nr:uracil phosphoribosyltransferase [Acaryochloris sp. SU_5_25]NJM64937.1 uracil phosphoribosyltransferase [Acaryochloris sp. RU_4_1]NJR54426.1 uracil phosphoribosyltransferase [Acaryochloris sp. CRU_2_0]
MAMQLRVYVPPHPLIKHWLAVARDRNTPGVLFRTAMTELGRWLTYEAMREWFPTLETTVETPLGPATAAVINPELPVAVVPILRAGLTLLDGAQSVIPRAATYHLGLARNEETLQPSCYLNKLPDTFAPQTRILITEPMLATGGSIMATLQELTQRQADPELIRIIAVVAAPPALKQLGENYPSLQIYTATIDEGLNDQGFIVPGLGDAGDRAFET